MKSISIAITILLVISPTVAFAHPDTLRADLMNDGVSVDNVKFIGVETRNTPTEKDLELFSVPWFWNNFMLFLIGSIISIMLLVIPLVYREESPNLKNKP